MIDKNHIIEKASQLFMVAGIRTNTMDDIALELGVSKKTLYQLVVDKKKLVAAVIGCEYINVNKRINEIALQSENSIDELLHLNGMIIKLLKRINPISITDLRKLYRPLYEDSKSKFNELFSSAINKCINTGKDSLIFREDTNVELITKIHTDKISQLQEAYGFWDSKSGSVETIKQLVSYYIRGLVTPQGEILLNKHILDFNKYLKE
jgi:AcrR family transcriptional regulator